jgi:hypothetical protein
LYLITGSPLADFCLLHERLHGGNGATVHKDGWRQRQSRGWNDGCRVFGYLGNGPFAHVLPVARTDQHFALQVGQLTTQHDAVHGALELATCERRPTCLRVGWLFRHDEFLRQVHLDECVRLLGQVEDALGIGVVPLNNVLNI